METLFVIVIALGLIYMVYKYSDPPKYGAASYDDFAKSTSNVSDEPVSNESPSKYPNHQEFEVVGVHIHSRKKYILDFCEDGDDVELSHDKRNKYSDQAVMVKHNGKVIGYIREEDLEDAHYLISKDHQAYISEVHFDGDYLEVEITIIY